MLTGRQIYSPGIIPENTIIFASTAYTPTAVTASGAVVRLMAEGPECIYALINDLPGTASGYTEPVQITYNQLVHPYGAALRVPAGALLWDACPTYVANSISGYTGPAIVQLYEASTANLVLRIHEPKTGTVLASSTVSAVTAGLSAAMVELAAGRLNVIFGYSSGVYSKDVSPEGTVSVTTYDVNDSTGNQMKHLYNVSKAGTSVFINGYATTTNPELVQYDPIEDPSMTNVIDYAIAGDAPLMSATYFPGRAFVADRDGSLLIAAYNYVAGNVTLYQATKTSSYYEGADVTVNCTALTSAATSTGGYGVVQNERSYFIDTSHSRGCMVPVSHTVLSIASPVGYAMTGERIVGVLLGKKATMLAAFTPGASDIVFYGYTS